MCCCARYTLLVVVVGLVAVAGTFGPVCNTACADESDITETLSADDAVSTVRWEESWAPVSWIEYTVTAAAVLGSLKVPDYIDPSARSNWAVSTSFDQEVAEHLSAGESGRAVAGTVSDVSLYTSLAYPYVDALIVYAVHGDAELAWQMTAMNLEAMAITNLGTQIAKHAVRRVRPDGGCQSGGACDDVDRQASFWSGHTSMSFVGAGLSCAHHENIDIYGGGVGDTVACVASTGVAALTGVMRIVANRHHTTDVLLGAGFGFGIGYFFPSVFHYWHDATATFLPEDTFLAPLAEQDAIGLSIIGVF